MKYPTTEVMLCPDCETEVIVDHFVSEAIPPDCEVVCDVDWSSEDGRNTSALIPKD